MTTQTTTRPCHTCGAEVTVQWSRGSGGPPRRVWCEDCLATRVRQLRGKYRDSLTPSDELSQST